MNKKFWKTWSFLYYALGAIDVILGAQSAREGRIGSSVISFLLAGICVLFGIKLSKVEL